MRIAQQRCRFCDGIFATRAKFKFDWLRDFYIDNLSPHIAWNVDLRGRTCTLGLGNDACQNFGNTGRVADFFLIGDHIFEQFHLFNFLETTLADCFVGCLWCNQQQRRVVPIGCFNRSHKVCNAWSVLCDHHRHFTGRACVTV